MGGVRLGGVRVGGVGVRLGGVRLGGVRVGGGGECEGGSVTSALSLRPLQQPNTHTIISQHTYKQYMLCTRLPVVLLTILWLLAS